MEEFLGKLLKSLNMIEVKGKANIDVLLGCILAVENVLGNMKNQDNEEGDEDG